MNKFALWTIWILGVAGYTLSLYDMWAGVPITFLGRLGITAGVLYFVVSWLRDTIRGEW